MDKILENEKQISEWLTAQAPVIITLRYMDYIKTLYIPKQIDTRLSSVESMFPCS